MRTWLINTQKKEKEYYKGLEIHADTGLHEQMMHIIEKYLPKGTKILDIGAGSGAFSQRMADHGYSVTALDIEDIHNNIPEIPFFQLDINKSIQDLIQAEYPAACCMEVIEHVENPWKLLRECRDIVEPGGYLFLSTPNITNFYSRIHFLFKGEIFQFQEPDLEYGHINPISPFELKVIAERTGWQVCEIIPGGYLPVFDFSVLSIKVFLLNIFRGLVFLASKGLKNGWVLAYVLKQNHPGEL